VSGVRLTVRAKPRAKKSRVVAVAGLNVDVAIAALPVEGRANEELVAVLAEALRVPKRAITLVVGASGRNKVVEVTGLEADEVSRRLAENMAGGG
jgi:uncharacterized protein